MSCGFIDGSRSMRARVDKMARSDVARVQIRSTRFARIRRHVLERRSANCYFWIGELGDSVRVVLPRKNLSQRGFRLSDSAIWIVRLWIPWHGRLLAPSDSAGRRTAGIPADQILQRPR